MIAAITMALIIGAAYFMPDLSTVQGSIHPEFASMQRGGEATTGSTLWIGWGFGIAAVVLIFSMLSLGVARKRSFRGAGWPLIGSFLASIATWTGVIYAYGGFVSNPQQDLLFGWPLPTGLMLFVMLPAMFLVNVVFVVFFPKSILTDEDLRKYDQLQHEDNPEEGA